MYKCDSIMNDKMKQPRDCYTPDKRINEYINDRMKLVKILKSKDRSRFSTEDKNFDTKLRQDKKRLLDNVIFPSMANLILFFQYMAENEELREIFEDDIRELFGYVSADQGKVMTGLIESILTWDMDKDPNNFRLGLMYEIQLIIRSQIFGLADREFSKPELIGARSIIDTHMNQAVAWTGLYYSRYDNSDQGKEDKNQLPKRPIR